MTVIRSPGSLSMALIEHKGADEGIPIPGEGPMNNLKMNVSTPCPNTHHAGERRALVFSVLLVSVGLILGGLPPWLEPAGRDV